MMVDRRRTELLLLGLLGLVVVLRVFIYSAAFPFFNNVDERDHFDLVVKYSRGVIPRALLPLSQQSAQFILLFGSPEYMYRPEQMEGGRFPPPPWTWPPAPARAYLEANTPGQLAIPNRESLQMPLYYVVAAIWLSLGEFCGAGGIYLLYWLRALNLLLAPALVVVGFVAAREVFPDRPFLRWSVPLLLAFHPQDIFYGIQNDVLSPLGFGLAFVGLVKLWKTERPSPGLGAFIGSMLAATALVKLTNWPLLGAAAVAIVYRMRLWSRAGQLAGAGPALAWLAACAAFPVGAWLLGNYWSVGDFSGTSAKVHAHGWTVKSLAHWWPHPIFTLHGLGEFWRELSASFWRGEFVWGRVRLASPAADAGYWLTSALLPLVAVASLVRPATAETPQLRPSLWLAAGSFVLAVAFLGVASVRFDFGNCYYPSREHPFFTSGRLLTGALVPFLLLYAYGLDRALDRGAMRRFKWPALGFILLAITISEAVVNGPAFASRYNWFHL